MRRVKSSYIVNRTCSNLFLGFIVNNFGVSGSPGGKLAPARAFINPLHYLISPLQCYSFLINEITEPTRFANFLAAVENISQQLSLHRE
jgi:hypothetical protein